MNLTDAELIEVLARELIAWRDEAMRQTRIAQVAMDRLRLTNGQRRTFVGNVTRAYRRESFSLTVEGIRYNRKDTTKVTPASV